MDRTEATIRNLLAALPAPGYDLGILSERGMYRLEAVSHDRFVQLIPYLKYRNANDSHIYLRPTGESACTLLNDSTEGPLTEAGYGPAAAIKTRRRCQPDQRHPVPPRAALRWCEAKPVIRPEAIGQMPGSADRNDNLSK